LSRNVTQQNTPSFPLDGGAARTVAQPTAENTTSGTFVEVTPGSGVWDYTTSYALPSGFDQAATYALAVYATRTVGSVRYVANAERFFIPGSDVAQPAPRTVVNAASCANCHNPLQAHGGSRQDVQLCLTCHTQGAVDPESGNSIDFNVMIHRIHRGKDLPSVKAGRKYQIIGNSLSVNDWSHAGFPQPVANCQVCHTASDSDRWVTNGLREACVSCHDNISEPNVHPIPLQPTTNCGNAVCHAPTVDAVSRDAREAHIVSLNTPSAPVLDLKILSISATMDSAPIVRFSAYTGTRQSGAGPVDGGAPLGTPVNDVNALSLLEAFINGPNTGFVQNGNNLKRYAKDQLVSLSAGTPGEFTFALPKTTRELFDLGADSEDEGELAQQSYTLSLRGQFDPTPGAAPDSDRVDMLRNPSAPFSPVGTASARKAIVSTDNCNKCHGELSAHGGGNLAKAIDQCVMCHTGSLDTRVRQGANKLAGPTRSLRLSTLVHRIHGGAKATEPYVLFGFSAMAPYPQLDFSDIGYPGDLRSCTTCHLTGTYFLPLPEKDPPSRTVSLDAEGKVIGP
jgi:OmcA/MtrC family decaheme c-type cytochrome